jgi:hypothetical protein
MKIDRREFLREAALISAGAVLLPAALTRKAQAQATTYDQTFYVSKNHPGAQDINDGVYGLSADYPWKTMYHWWDTVNRGSGVLPELVPVYVQQQNPDLTWKSVLVNIGPGIYNQTDPPSPNYDPFAFGQRPNQHIKGSTNLPGFQKVILTPHVPEPHDDFTLLETSDLSLLPADSISIDSCFVYLTTPSGRINDSTGVLSLKNSLLLGYQGPDYFQNPGDITFSSGENYFDNPNLLEHNIVAGFGVGASDTRSGLTKFRRVLFWRNNYGITVDGIPDIGNGNSGAKTEYDPGENVFFENTSKTLKCNGNLDLGIIPAEGNWWYDSSGKLLTSSPTIIGTMEGVVDATTLEGITSAIELQNKLTKSGDPRPIYLEGFGTNDILKEGEKMPVVSGAGLRVLLTGIVGAGLAAMYRSESRPYRPSREEISRRRFMEREQERAGNIREL